jgi:MFS family permease
VNRRQLGLLWLGSFAFFLSFLLLLAALPLFARRLVDSDAAVGLVMAVFGVPSLLLRTVTGWGADRFGRRPLMLSGAGVFTVASVAYAWATGLAGLVLVRLVHGAGMGLYPTAASAMVADLAPPQRRGEILGYYGAAGSIALAIGPVAGIAIVEHAGFAALFWTAGATALLSLLVTLGVGETLAERRRVRLSARDAVSRAALLPAGLALCLTFSYGTLVAFLPLHATARGVNPGVFFLVFAVTITLARGPAGRLSDRVGRPPVAGAGLVLTAAALVILALADDLAGLAAAGAVNGLAYGAAQPALAAWSVDRVAEGERGRAMGTYHSAFELGIIAGATSAGLAVAHWGFAGTFLATAAVAAVGAAVALTRPRRARLDPPAAC